MKRLNVLLLMFVISLTLCACGGSNEATKVSETTTETPTETTASEEVIMTKEEMLEQALSVNQTTINNDSIDNIVKAKSLYCNTVLLLEGEIVEIEEDHIEIGTSSWVVDVYLPIEEMINLKNDQKILVVGQTNDTIEEETWSNSGYSGTISHYSMPNAYLVQDEFEITGIIRSKRTDYNNGFDFKIGDNPYLWILIYEDNYDKSNVKDNGDGSITVRGVICPDAKRIYVN